MRSGSQTKLASSAHPVAPMPASERWSSLVACSLVLLAPFVIFVRHHDYALWRPEVLLAGAMIGLVGLAFGLMLAFLPAVVRVAIASAFVVLFVDLQMNWIDSGVRGLCVLLPGLAVLWPLRAHLGRILAFACTVMILATLPMDPGDGWIRRVSFEGDRAPNPELPMVLHIILDEQIAIGGIPREFDPQRTVRRRLERAYGDLGFHVFTRAFSRHFTTQPSLSHLVNFSRGDRSFEFYDPDTKAVTQNAYFEEMSRRGYRIHVFQTDYLDFCRSAGEIELASCVTYTLESVKALEPTQLATADKARTIAGMFVQLSHLLKEGRREYKDLVADMAGEGTSLPAWPLRAGRMSTVSSRQLLPVLEEELSTQRGGALVFAHLLLPHFPYAYDRQCNLRPAPVDWLTYKARSLHLLRNTVETRAARYGPYLEQVGCTTQLVTDMLRRLSAAGRLRDALVIVHGDHGSRINLTTPNQPNMHQLNTADFTDAFSTHFAYRTPTAAAVTDRRSVAIDEILAAIVEHGTVAGGTDWIRSQDVFITGERRDHVVHLPMRWGDTETK